MIYFLYKIRDPPYIKPTLEDPFLHNRIIPKCSANIGIKLKKQLHNMNSCSCIWIQFIYRTEI